MKPHEIFNKIEEVWKCAAIKKMALELITSGAVPADPEAFTYEQQEKSWGFIVSDLRIILDELEKLGKRDTWETE